MLFSLFVITLITTSVHWTILHCVVFLTEDMISACNRFSLIPVKTSICYSIVHTYFVSCISTFLTLRIIKSIGYFGWPVEQVKLTLFTTIVLSGGVEGPQPMIVSIAMFV